jgi:hypothetical protein
MEYEDLLSKVKNSNEIQLKVALAAVMDFHSPKPFRMKCPIECPPNCLELHYDEKQGCQCGSWYPCQTMQLLERTIDWL